MELQDDDLNPLKDLDDLENDDLKRDLADALSSVFPELVVFTYEVTDDCTLFCNPGVPHGSTWNPYLDRVEEESIISRFDNVRSLLLSLYKEATVLGPEEGEEPAYISQGDFIQRIIRDGDCATGSEMGGNITF